MDKSLFSPSYEAVRKHLLDLRKKAGMTQRELAKKVGREQNFVARIELRERRVDLLEYFEICRACGVKPDAAATELMRELLRLSKIQKRASKKTKN